MSTLVDLPSPLSRIEEIANSITHALGFALAMVASGVLLRYTSDYGDTLQMVGVSVYSITLLALYGASTLSHCFERPRVRHFFRTLDQVCIFLLIAGTYTPISLTYLRHEWWWVLFIAVWTLAAAGIFAKIFLTRLHNVAVSAYVLLGWLPCIAIKPIMAAMPGEALAWLAIGGVLYTLGTLFLLYDERVPFFHAVWHVFVIAASACQYYAVLRFIVPWPS
jgi:hemolysin III